MAGARHGFILSLIPSFNKRYDTLFRFRDGCSVLTINPQRLFGELPAQFSSPPNPPPPHPQDVESESWAHPSSGGGGRRRLHSPSCCFRVTTDVGGALAVLCG